jgi:hypothetical protein
MSFRAKVSTKNELITRKTEQDSLNSYIYTNTQKFKKQIMYCKFQQSNNTSLHQKAKKIKTLKQSKSIVKMLQV